MGCSRFSADEWERYATSRSTMSRADIFRSKRLPDALNPKLFQMRESRDSALNPASTALIAAIDVTGSMGMLAEVLVRKGIGTAFEKILERAQQPNSCMVSDPHLMVMAIGDVDYQASRSTPLPISIPPGQNPGTFLDLQAEKLHGDQAPLQMTQFEADLTIARQLEEVWLEGGGGGNCSESYNLAWYAAATRTSIDCFEKRGRKGYLFTVGDEEAPPPLTETHIRRVLGDLITAPLDNFQLLTMVERSYHVFHIIVEQGSHARGNLDRVRNSWTELLGERVILLPDINRLAEVIVSAIEVVNGRDVDDTVASWSGDTSLVVARAVGGLRSVPSAPASGVLRF